MKFKSGIVVCSGLLFSSLAFCQSEKTVQKGADRSQNLFDSGFHAKKELSDLDRLIQLNDDLASSCRFSESVYSHSVLSDFAELSSKCLKERAADSTDKSGNSKRALKIKGLENEQVFIEEILTQDPSQACSAQQSASTIISGLVVIDQGVK